MNMNMNILIIRTITLLYFFSLSATQDIYEQWTADGMVGSCPEKIAWVIQHLSIAADCHITNLELKPDVTVMRNRLLLYGPPGNGKSTIAQKIAHIANCELVRMDGPSVVGSYIGQGAQNIRETFDQAQKIVEETGKNVIIFIDEIDAIAASNNTEFRSEHKASLQQLWLELDRYKNNKHIFIIFATNHFDKLSKAFIDRFGNNIIEITNPDYELRKKILTHYSILHNVPFASTIIDKLATYSEGLSIRSLEDFVIDIALALQVRKSKIVDEALLWKTLSAIKKKFNDNKSDEDTKQESLLQRVNMTVATISGLLTIALSMCQLYLFLSNNNLLHKFFIPGKQA